MRILRCLSGEENWFNTVQLPPFFRQYIDGIRPERGNKLNY
jgi:hypothetical protein